MLIWTGQIICLKMKFKKCSIWITSRIFNFICLKYLQLYIWLYEVLDFHICRFEKLDITPKSAQKIKPVLERWMALAEERYKNGMQNLSEFIGLEPSKKRKRRTSFTPQALELLNEHFERSTHPSGSYQLSFARTFVQFFTFLISSVVFYFR